MNTPTILRIVAGFAANDPQYSPPEAQQVAA